MAEDQWTTHSSNTTCRRYGFRVIGDEVTSPGGDDFTYFFARIDRGVVVIPVDDENNVYLNQEYRYPTKETDLEAVGGRIDEGETPKDAARKELREEAGLEARILTPLGTTTVMPGNIDALTHGYLATGLIKTTANPDGYEIINSVKMPLQKAVQMALSGEIRNAETVTYLLRAAHKLKEIN